MDSIASLHNELKSVNKMFDESLATVDSQAITIPRLKKQISDLKLIKTEKLYELEVTKINTSNEQRPNDTSF